jgi:hypothetical protein
MARTLLCYCLGLTYEDIRRLWARGHFARPSDRLPGLYCTSCRADLDWFLRELEGAPHPGDEPDTPSIESA